MKWLLVCLVWLLKYDIHREAAKISALVSGKIHEYEYFTGKTILPSDQSTVIEQEKAYSLLEKALEKQLNKIEDHWNINKNKIDWSNFSMRFRKHCN